MITEMRGTDFIVFSDLFGSVMTVIQCGLSFLGLVETVMEINPLAGFLDFQILFFLCGGSQSSFWPKFALWFCTCQHA